MAAPDLGPPPGTDLLPPAPVDMGGDLASSTAVLDFASPADLRATD